MSQFVLQILTPERVVYDGWVQRLLVRTTEGELGILARHETFSAALPEGPVRLVAEDGSERLAALSGGMLKVSAEQTVILANAVEWAEEIDIHRAKRSQEEALRRKAAGGTPLEQRRAEAKLRRAVNRLRVAERQP